MRPAGKGKAGTGKERKDTEKKEDSRHPAGLGRNPPKAKQIAA
jgi:hypothetical protein